MWSSSRCLSGSLGDEVVEDRAVAVSLGDVGLCVVEQALGPERRADQDVGDVVRKVELFEIVLPGAVVEVAKDDDGSTGIGVQALLEVAASVRRSAPWPLHRPAPQGRHHGLAERPGLVPPARGTPTPEPFDQEGESRPHGDLRSLLAGGDALLQR